VSTHMYVCVYLDFLNNCSSESLGRCIAEDMRKEVWCRVGSCLDERLSRKLQIISRSEQAQNGHYTGWLPRTQGSVEEPRKFRVECGSCLSERLPKKLQMGTFRMGTRLVSLKKGSLLCDLGGFDLAHLKASQTMACDYVCVCVNHVWGSG